MTGWLDDLVPHDDTVSRAQIDAVVGLLTPPRRVLDVGCGDGRVAGPLARAGCAVVGVEADAAHAAACRAAVGPEVIVLEERFPGPRAREAGPFDAVLLLGNLLMTVPDVDEAVDLLGACAGVLAPGGMVVTDDVPGLFWPEVAEGYWQSGTSEDGSLQLAWEEDDAVFTVRTGARVQPEAGVLGPGDVRYRLWTRGALRLAARAAGLSLPERLKEGGVLIMRRLVDPRSAE